MPLPRLVVSDKARQRIDLSKHSFLMLEPALCRCPGLFRHIRKQDQDLQELIPMTLEYTGTSGEIIRFKSKTLLGGFDFAVLQGLLSIGRQCLENRSDPDSSIGSSSEKVDLVSRLMAPPDGVPPAMPPEGDISIIGFPLQDLLQVAGLQENGRNTAAARRSLLRLEGTTMAVHDCATKTDTQPARLLAVSFPSSADKGYRAWAVINPRLMGFLRRKTHQHVRISLVEARKLKDNLAARFLHQRLAAIIDDDNEESRRMETIVNYLFPDDAFSAALEKERAHAIASYAKLRSNPTKLLQTKIDDTIEAMTALQELLQWEIKLLRNDGHALDALWSIRRPKVNLTKHEVRILKLKKKQGR